LLRLPQYLQQVLVGVEVVDDARTVTVREKPESSPW
jgi:hypothetical protein